MTRTSSYLLLSLVALFFITSCSIEKRTFNRGYHVTWNHSLKKQKSVEQESVTPEEELAQNENKTAEEQILLVTEEKSSLAADEKAVIESIENDELSGVEEQILSETPSETRDTVYFYPTFEPRGIVSFATSLAAYATFFVAIEFWEVLIFASFALLIVGMIFGLLSLRAYKRNKMFYRKNVFGIIGVSLALAPILIWLGAFIIDSF